MLTLPIDIDIKSLITLPEPPIDTIKKLIDPISKDVVQFGKALASIRNKINVPAVVPLAYYKDKKVVTFPNLMVPMDMQSRGELTAPFIDEMRHKFYGGLAVSRFERKWLNAEGMWIKSEETTPARYLGKLVEGEKDDVIRGAADMLDAFYRPMELIYPKDEVGYVEMYKVGATSCMRVGNYSHINRLLGEEFLKQGLWPSIFWLYCHDIKGVFIRKDGVPVARCFIFRNETTGEFDAYSKPYCVTPEYGTLFTNELSKLYKRGQQYSHTIRKPFEVPAYTILGGLYAPMPSCDNIAYSSFRVVFDPTRKVFTFGPSDLLPKGATEVMDGYVNSGFVAAERTMKYDGIIIK